MRITASSLLGVGLLLFGLTVIAAWLAGKPSLLTVEGGRVPQFSGALCFALMGAALAAQSVLRADVLRTVRALLGAGIVSIACAMLLEHVFAIDLGIDLAELHRFGPEEGAHPGRVAIPTAVAALLAGVALVWMDRVQGIAGGLLVQGCTIAVFVAGFVGFAGRAIRLPLMYPGSAFASMSLLTAVGLMAVAAAMWLAWRRMGWYEARTLTRSEEQRISLAGSAVLALIVCVAVLSGFAITVRHLEDEVRSGLLESLKSQAELARITVDYRSRRATILATRPFVVEQLARLHADVSDANAFGSLTKEADSLLRLGFSAVSFYGLHGEPGGAAGSPVEQPAAALPIKDAQRTVLMWDDGFVLYNRITVERGGEPVGVMVAEQRLTELTDALRKADDFAQSAEIAVCRRVAADLECVRQSAAAAVFRVAYSSSLPAARALEGSTGVVVGRDDRDQFAMTAYGPVGGTGLAITLKRDTAEMYAPRRNQLSLAFLLMAAMIALGVWLLRRRIAPLVSKLEDSEERLALAVEGSRLALWDLDAHTGRVWLDAQWARMLGAGSSPTQTTAQELVRLVHPDDIAPFRQHLAGVLQGKAEHYDIEHRFKKPSGEWLWIHSRGKVVQRDGAGRALRLAGINEDIDLRKQLELRLAHQAGHDALTGLPNRNLFHDRIERAIGRSRRHGALMALMYLDIDRFKSVNDTHGHDVGDALIRGFAQRLVECIRGTDTAARLGGDEFAVILEELEDVEAGRRVAEKIVAAMREPFVLGEHTLAVSTSAGISFYRGKDPIDIEAIVKQADRALYEAKAAGRNTYRVSLEETA